MKVVFLESASPKNLNLATLHSKETDEESSKKEDEDVSGSDLRHGDDEDSLNCATFERPATKLSCFGYCYNIYT